MTAGDRQRARLGWDSGWDGSSPVPSGRMEGKQSAKRQIGIYSIVSATLFVVCVLAMFGNPEGVGLAIFGGGAVVFLAGFVWLRAMAAKLN